MSWLWCFNQDPFKLPWNSTFYVPLSGCLSKIVMISKSLKQKSRTGQSIKPFGLVSKNKFLTLRHQSQIIMHLWSRYDHLKASLPKNNLTNLWKNELHRTECWLNKVGVWEKKNKHKFVFTRKKESWEKLAERERESKQAD